MFVVVFTAQPEPVEGLKSPSGGEVGLIAVAKVPPVGMEFEKKER